MPLNYTKLDVANLHTIQSLLFSYLQREWSQDLIDAFLSWRFLDRDFSETVLALDGAECVAMVNSTLRQYEIDGKKTGVRETDFWISREEYRPFASMRVLQTLMRKPEPICAISGTDYVTSILQRMQWRPLPEISQMVLPLSPGAAVKSLAQRMGKNVEELPAFLTRPFAFRFRRPKRQPAPAPSATFEEITDPKEVPDIMPPANAYASAALADHHDFEWYAAAPDRFGEFVWLVFSIGGEPVALTLSRLYKEGPYLGAKIFHVQSALHRPDVYAWVLGETSAFVHERGACWIDARLSCPVVTRALEQVGYIKGQTHLPFWWPGSQQMPEGEYLVSVLLRGEGLAPYPLR